MQPVDPEPGVVAQGLKTIICATTALGRRPAEADLASLSEKERVRMQALFDLFAETGRIANKEKFKKLDGTEFYEFRNRDLRFLCFWDPLGRLALSHMFRKGGQKAPRRELARAEDIKREHTNFLALVAGGGQ